jgi:hypothetical protein
MRGFTRNAEVFSTEEAIPHWWYGMVTVSKFGSLYYIPIYSYTTKYFYWFHVLALYPLCRKCTSMDAARKCLGLVQSRPILRWYHSIYLNKMRKITRNMIYDEFHDLVSKLRPLEYEPLVHVHFYGGMCPGGALFIRLKCKIHFLQGNYKNKTLGQLARGFVSST